MVTIVPVGTRIRFRNWPDKLGLELAGQAGKVKGSYSYGLDEVRYDIDVGPGWGTESYIKRTDFAVTKE